MIDPGTVLENVTGRYAKSYADIIQQIVISKVLGDRAALDTQRQELDRIVQETMGIGEILGASITLKLAASIIPKEGLAFKGDTSYLMVFADTPEQNILPRVTFDEAVQDMVDRTPVTIRQAAERTAQRISQLYGEGRVVAFARAAEQAATVRAQGLIAEAIRKGIPELDYMQGGVLKPGAGTTMAQAVNTIQEKTQAWSKGYAKMAFRTNFNTAVTAGRFRQSQDPDIKKVVPCFRFDSVGDADTRHNHDLLDGKIFRVDNTIWNRIAPPLGYNCRCDVTPISIPELRRMGRVGSDGSVIEDRTIPADAGPDAGFRHPGRPDLFMVGA